MSSHRDSVVERGYIFAAVSSILEVLPEDPKQPRMILSVLDGKSGITNGHLELDTIESAREWRREIQGLGFCREQWASY